SRVRQNIRLPPIHGVIKPYALTHVHCQRLAIWREGERMPKDPSAGTSQIRQSRDDLFAGKVNNLDLVVPTCGGQQASIRRKRHRRDELDVARQREELVATRLLPEVAPLEPAQILLASSWYLPRQQFCRAGQIVLGE